MSNPSIKAIETRYKGCQFRSRLEARWAVFFDALGVKWEYEPEGFELPSGRYLPDFRLAYGLWVEVKGLPPSDRERRLFKELCEGTGFRGVMVWGAPHDAEWLSVDSEGDQVDQSEGEGVSSFTNYGLKEVLWLDAVLHERWVCACVASSSARFEHGESGAAR